MPITATAQTKNLFGCYWRYRIIIELEPFIICGRLSNPSDIMSRRTGASLMRQYGMQSIVSTTNTTIQRLKFIYIGIAYTKRTKSMLLPIVATNIIFEWEWQSDFFLCLCITFVRWSFLTFRIFQCCCILHFLSCEWSKMVKIYSYHAHLWTIVGNEWKYHTHLEL